MLIIPALQKWTRLPGERARALCLEVCERWVDGVGGWATAWEAGGDSCPGSCPVEFPVRPFLTQSF